MRQRYNKFSKNEKTKCGFMRCTHVISCNTHVRIMRARWTKRNKTEQAPRKSVCLIPASKVKREGKKGLFCWRKGKSRTRNVPHWDWKKTKGDKGARCTWLRSALRRPSQHAAPAIAAQCIFCPISLPASAQRFSRSNLVGAKYRQTEISSAKQFFSSFNSDNLPHRRTFLLHFAHFFAQNPEKWFARTLSTVRIHPQKAPQDQAKA